MLKATSTDTTLCPMSLSLVHTDPAYPSPSAITNINVDQLEVNGVSGWEKNLKLQVTTTGGLVLESALFDVRVIDCIQHIGFNAPLDGSVNPL